jgi:hypothetical protein
MTTDYRVTTLWTTAFGDAGLQNADQKTARDDLLAAFRKLDERVAPLLAKVDESCRELTIHDISHVHQLWSVASEICGPSFPLNPLEGFVLGVAFLIHDSGLTAAAYPGGLSALRKTNYYRDRVAALLRTSGADAPDEGLLENPSEEIAQRALFDTLRAIHSKRAETLLDETKPHPLTGQPYPLFPDLDLFLDCGEIIGLIAASHNWSVDDVDERFRDPLTPPASFLGWPIDALKLAAILRTADACAIDERRARIMPFLLSNPSGLSRDHWKFQAYLNPGMRREEAIVFQSKRPFARRDMSAWWVAYDAIGIADRELRDCDRLLRGRAISGRHHGLKPFNVRRVEGAGEATHLKEFVRVSGWVPVNTAIRIDNPITLVEKLGGWQLYGDDYSAPFREMLQNAADAVRARRRRPNGYTNNFEYPGRIDVCFEFKQSNDPFSDLTITISDDGVGMAPDVITGALLDFGRSFWDSGEAAEKYPGLLSDPFFQPTGKFGIGFYSIFMIADDVKVISRSWQAGLIDAKVMHFQSGVKRRAEFREYNVEEDGYISASHSTVIIAKIKTDAWIRQFAAMGKGQEYLFTSTDSNIVDDVIRTMKQLTFALDVACYLSISNTTPIRLNEPSIFKVSNESFAKLYDEVFDRAGGDASIASDAISLIDEIADAQGRVHTRGLIGVGGERGRFHIGGFVDFSRKDGTITGISAVNAQTAARSGGPRVATKNQMKKWGEEQLRRLVASSITQEERLEAIGKLCAINVDIRREALVRSDDTIVQVKRLVTEFSDTAILFVALQDIQYFLSLRRPSIRIDKDTPSSLDYLYSSNFIRDDLAELRQHARIGLSGGGYYYGAIVGSLDAPDNDNSAYAVLIQSLKSEGYDLKVDPPAEYVLGTYVGPEGGRGYTLSRELTAGAEFKKYGLLIHIKRDQK